MNKRDVF